MKLKDKVVVVIGASGGIGKEFSKIFHEEGASVVLAARTRERLEVIASDLSADRALVVPTDASNMTDTERLFTTTMEQFKKIDLVVLTTGTWEITGLDTTPEKYGAEIEKQTDAFLKTALCVGYWAGNFLRKQGFGIIANMSSHAATDPTLPGNIVYAGTKSGASQAMKSLRQELIDTGVEVINVYPGSVNTDKMRETYLLTPEAQAQAVQPETMAEWLMDCLDAHGPIETEKHFKTDFRVKPQ